MRFSRSVRGLVATGLFFVAHFVYAADPSVHRQQQDDGTVSFTTAAENTQQSQTTLSKIPYRKAVPGEYIVKFKNGYQTKQNFIRLNTASVKPIRSFSKNKQLQHIRIQPGVNARATIARMKADPSVEYIEPNYIIQLNAIPGDLRFDEQWGLNNTGSNTGAIGGSPNNDIDAVEAWDTVTSSGNAVIAVIDSGVDYNHEDLSANMYQNSADCNNDGVDDDVNGYVDDCYGIDTINSDSDPMDDNGHGTHVAGIIGAAGNNAVGVSGVLWDTQILSCKFTDSTGLGTMADAIACFDYIATMKQSGVNVIATNNSWGSYGYSQALRDAIAQHQQLGILMIAAAGNDGVIVDQEPFYPCAYTLPNVICVGAFNELGQSLFNYGQASVHLAAPGENIVSTLPNNQYGPLNGTSMAAPHVTGATGLVYGQDSNRDWVAIRNLILSTAKRFPTSVFAERYMMNGMLNVNDALNCVPSFRTDHVARILPKLRVIPFHSAGVPVTFSAYHIECANNAGSIDLTISPTGDVLTLLDDGLGQDEFAGDGIYTAVWIPTAGGRYFFDYPDVPSDYPVAITVDEHLEVGFPVKTIGLPGRGGGGYGISPLVGNIDADPYLEILATGLSLGPMYAWNHDGTAVDGWPQTFTDETGTYLDIRGSGYPSLAELDTSNPGFEVTVAYNEDDFVAYRGDGSVLPGWPVLAANSEAPGIADYNGDGVDEVFTGLRAFSADGTALAGWPNGTSGITPAFADLDNDGDLEVITVLTGGVTAHHHDGTRVNGFPAITNVTRLWGNPVVGDVDGDGAPEIMVTNGNLTADSSSVYVVSATGVLERQIDGAGGYPYGAALALADLDNDTFPEILLRTDSHMHIWKGDGSTLNGWPVAVPASLGGSFMSVVGDVDGDQSPDVVFMGNNGSAGSELRVYNTQGVLNPLMPKSVPGADSLAIADIDLDGRNEIVLRGKIWNGRIEYLDTIWAYDLGGSTPHGNIEWGQVMGNEKRQGHYGSLPVANVRNILSIVVNGPGGITSASGEINCPADCSGSYAPGAAETLTATADTNAEFDSWSGTCTGQGTACTFNIDSSQTITANFAALYDLTVGVSGNGLVTSNPTGIDCGVDCTESYRDGTSVTLSATPQTGYQFDSWSGACASQGATCSFTMSSALSTTANFSLISSYTLSTSVTGNGTVTSSPAGINCGTDCTESYVAGTIVQLTATPVGGYNFSAWTGACTGQGNPCTVTMSSAQSVAANFALIPPVTYQLSVTPDSNGTVTSSPAGINCGADCTESYVAGTVVQLTATPAGGYNFSAWTGACAAQGNPCTVTMTTSLNTTASYIPIPPPSFSMLININGSGSVISNPVGINCSTGVGGGNDCIEMFDQGSAIQLTATPAADNQFDGWAGACAAQGNPCNVTMTATTSVTANFSAVNTGSGGGCSLNPNGRFDPILPLLFILSIIHLYRRRILSL